MIRYILAKNSHKMQQLELVKVLLQVLGLVLELVKVQLEQV
jgi:hypothetical protein